MTLGLRDLPQHRVGVKPCKQAARARSGAEPARAQRPGSRSALPISTPYSVASGAGVALAVGAAVGGCRTRVATGPRRWPALVPVGSAGAVAMIFGSGAVNGSSVAAGVAGVEGPGLPAPGGAAGRFAASRFGGFDLTCDRAGDVVDIVLDARRAASFELLVLRRRPRTASASRWVSAWHRRPAPPRAQAGRNDDSAVAIALRADFAAAGVSTATRSATAAVPPQSASATSGACVKCRRPRPAWGAGLDAGFLTATMALREMRVRSGESAPEN